MSKKVVSRFILFILCISISNSFAQDATTSEQLARLQNIKSELERDESEYRRVKATLDKGTEELNDLDNQLLQFAEEKQEAGRSVSEAAERRNEIKDLIQKAEARKAELGGGFSDRLVGIYKLQRRRSGIRYVFQSRSATDILRRGRFLAAVAQYDQSYLRILTQTMSELEKEQGKLDTVEIEYRGRIDEIASLELAFSDRKQKKEVLVKLNETRSKELEKTIARLKKSADELEKALGRLTGGVPINAQKTAGSVFLGVGLGSLKGKLVLPVLGKIVKGFGKQKHEGTLDYVFVKGVEVATYNDAPASVNVKAIAPGKVVYDDQLPTLGRVVILDHGSRYYSLYGRLDTVSVSLNDMVSSDKVLGRAGKKNAEGSNFYFEIRVQGKAVDPSEFLRKN